MTPRPRPPGAGHPIWRTGPPYLASDRPLARLVARPLREFLRIETAGSVVLLSAAALALLWANSPWSESYQDFWHAEIGLDVAGFTVTESVRHWVNEALMVIFFFVVGLEIKYELVRGDLREPRTAALPIVAALGGMVAPAVLYLAIAGDGQAGSGWGIPMATDIAFAVGVLGLLGRRIPSPARLFLLTLAIVDDIGAIVVIAVFYTADLHFAWLGAALGLLVLIVALRALRVWVIPVYVVLGFCAWFAMLESGVHATLVGVAVGLIAPTGPLLEESVSREYAQSALRDRHLDAEELIRMRFLLRESVPVVDRLQTRLHPVSAYVVLPLFALANAGVELGGGALGEAVTSTVALGIMAGLVIGKPVGILLASLVAVKSGLARLPERTTWSMMTGLGLVAGIGFTVSLFIAGLSFPGQQLTANAKVGILLASMTAAVLGTLVLVLSTRRRPGGDGPAAPGGSGSGPGGGGADPTRPSRPAPSSAGPGSGPSPWSPRAW